MSSSEATLISKALRLVSFAIIVAIVTIGISAAYSGYEEYGALTGAVNSQSTSSNGGQLSESINGSALQISGLSIPNKMTYPLDFEILGSVSIANVSVAKFDSGSYRIAPGETKNVSVNVGLNFSNALASSSVFRSLLLNSSKILVNTTIDANMVPLLGINLTKSANTTAGPALSGLSVNLETSRAALSPDGSFVVVPAVISWQNLSPFAFGGLSLNATLTKIPGRGDGNYGSAIAPVILSQGANNLTLNFHLPISDFAGGSVPHGGYTIAMVISIANSTEQAMLMETVNA